MVLSGDGLCVHVHIPSIESRPRVTSAALPTRKRQDAPRPLPGRPVIEVLISCSPVLKTALSLSLANVLHCSAYYSAL